MMSVSTCLEFSRLAKLSRPARIAQEHSAPIPPPWHSAVHHFHVLIAMSPSIEWTGLDPLASMTGISGLVMTSAFLEVLEATGEAPLDFCPLEALPTCPAGP